MFESIFVDEIKYDYNIDVWLHCKRQHKTVHNNIT